MAKIFLASDHAGYELKESLSAFLRERGYEIEDCGAFSLEPADDYPDYMLPMAAKVAEHEGAFGIAIGGSGQGEAVACNRVPGVRAAVYYGKSLEIIKLSREHNDANVLSLGARFMSADEAEQAALIWLTTPFSKEERHARRISKIDHA
jgi:ribose 5-phosphate isomerase B